MTGLYVRIKRCTGYENVEVENMTEDELIAFINSQPEADGWSWFTALLQWVKDNVKEKE